MTTYQATSTLPPLVQQATAGAAERGFTASCTPEVGRWQRGLAGACRQGRVGAIQIAPAAAVILATRLG